MSYEGAQIRPGKTLAGFQKALARLPDAAALWALAQGVRDQIQRNYAERLVIDGFIPMGCDGSRVECPRAVELEARLGKGEQRDISPDCLGDGVRASGDWGCSGHGGSAKAPPTNGCICGRCCVSSPPQALVVADAAYSGL